MTAPAPVFLIGFMGSGKSTLGRAVGARPGWCYIDLDDLIEEREGMTVRQIFQTRGEQWFRARESSLLREAAAMAPPGARVVVGCGGGTPCHSANMQWMNDHGTTVLLRASSGVLLRRLLDAQEQRPLLAGMTPARLSAFIEAKQLEREPWYGQAALTLCSDRLECEREIASTVEEFLALVSPRPPHFNSQEKRQVTR